MTTIRQETDRKYDQSAARNTLGFVKSFPDAIRGGIGESAFQIPEGLQFVVAADRLFQECPQAVN